MLRIALALIAFSLVSSPAAAARLAHPSAGDGLTPGMRMTRRPLTQGFYADRMAAGY